MAEYTPVPTELIEQGIADGSGHLSDAAYELVTDLIPITCVDMIPVDTTGDTVRLGAIVRATGQEAGKIAVIGGRVQKNEHLEQAMKRHLASTVGSGVFSLHRGNEVDRPFMVAQYQHRSSSGSVFDPTKHSISMTYLVTIPEPDLTLVGNEASAFAWFDIDNLPNTGAFNQHLILRKAAQFITDHS